mmetsp:Transcript_53754/g.154327  ORF Transcript_53754/g.154327 Transcript_53754/m.154327 type:complete len:265 (-) Transcript_53754:583-1377(-)
MEGDGAEEVRGHGAQVSRRVAAHAGQSGGVPEDGRGGAEGLRGARQRQGLGGGGSGHSRASDIEAERHGQGAAARQRRRPELRREVRRVGRGPVLELGGRSPLDQGREGRGVGGSRQVLGSREGHLETNGHAPEVRGQHASRGGADPRRAGGLPEGARGLQGRRTDTERSGRQTSAGRRFAHIEQREHRPQGVPGRGQSGHRGSGHLPEARAQEGPRLLVLGLLPRVRRAGRDQPGHLHGQGGPQDLRRGAEPQGRGRGPRHAR